MAHQIECGKYTVERIPYAEEQQELVTEDVFIARIAPLQTSRILQFAGKSLPKLDGIEHVKRVKRDTRAGNTNGLLVVLCQCKYLDRSQFDAVVQDTEWADLEILVVKVPSNPPYTSAQFEQWSQVWPVTYRPPLKLKKPEFSSDEKGYVEMCLQAAMQMKSNAADTENRARAVVMGKLQTRKIVAQAADTTSESGHPLRHAVMNCIALVADREVARLTAEPIDDNNTGESNSVPVKRSHELCEDRDVGGYLCEGLDVFAVREPCVMCTMALVHSRIGRLFFVEQSPSGGISRYAMHSHKALNHNFTAFVCHLS
ncbi:tRNA-specific adenosine deaminase subunit tad3 [Coemansia sp. RSA 451]|nr:tRNA-specific adenosine deaminase subunit tad3 [Coemansia sp. RSA 562]KAJ2273710.1 tRNA-specific adenosine deaminase subunit tad3 [Coemansia sp. RSA 451]